MLGKQALFTRQAPQRLKVLREHALIESAVSSNRIEGVEVDQKRIGTLVFGKAALRDRDEEEVRGYRDALNLIHTQGSRLDISQETIRQLHRLTRGNAWDAGAYRKKDTDIIERHADGRTSVRFKPTSVAKTPAAMAKLVEDWRACIEQRWVHPLVALAAFNLDFLCIHPFRDGNGRTSRLLLLLQSYRAGMEVGRYVSLERIIEQNKERYRQASPITYVSPAVPPILLVHGEEDPAVTFKDSQSMAERLRAVGADVTLIPVKHAGHDFRSSPGTPISPSAEEIVARTIEFFDKHLRND